MTAPIPDAAALQEAVARAIYEEDDPWHAAWPWPNPKEVEAEKYRQIAQAAVAVVVEACAGLADIHARERRIASDNAKAIKSRQQARDYESMSMAAVQIATAIRKLAQPLQGEVG